MCLQAHGRMDRSPGLRHAGDSLRTGRREAKVQGNLRHTNDLGQQLGWLLQCSHQHSATLSLSSALAPTSHACRLPCPRHLGVFASLQDSCVLVKCPGLHGLRLDYALQTLENVGTKAFSRGDHNITYQNTNLLGMKDTYGFNVTELAVGCAYGNLSLVRALPPPQFDMCSNSCGTRILSLWPAPGCCAGFHCNACSLMLCQGPCVT